MRVAAHEMGAATVLHQSASAEFAERFDVLPMSPLSAHLELAIGENFDVVRTFGITGMDFQSKPCYFPRPSSAAIA
jgi:hypothetical protein